KRGKQMSQDQTGTKGIAKIAKIAKIEDDTEGHIAKIAKADDRSAGTAKSTKADCADTEGSIAKVAKTAKVAKVATAESEGEDAPVAPVERDPERLEFRVASGRKGAGAVAMPVERNQGIAGYVYSTGEALALSDVAADPRWDRAVAERTGYVPRSIAAVPLVNEAETVGVLQVLDKHSAPSFTMRDMELLAVFASQAAAAIAATKVQRDLPSLIASSLR